MKLLEVNAETIGDALVDWLPEIEVDGTALNGKMEKVERFGKALLAKLPDVNVESSYWVPHWPG